MPEYPAASPNQAEEGPPAGSDRAGAKHERNPYEPSTPALCDILHPCWNPGERTLETAATPSRETGATLGKVDFDFKPSVPVFDANVALGRRRDRTVSVDTAEGTVNAMDRAGVDRALVYSTRSLSHSGEGNQVALDATRELPRLVPQFVCNPADDELEDFVAATSAAGARSVRMFPEQHKYPFRDWAVKPWLEWLASEHIPLWIGADDFDSSALHDTLERHPDVAVVLCEVHYFQAPWAKLLLKSLPNLYIEVSRVVGSDGIATLVDTVGDRRVLYDSRFPDSPMAPQLYNLHRSGLSETSLKAVCSGNLERLMDGGR